MHRSFHRANTQQQRWSNEPPLRLRQLLLKHLARASSEEAFTLTEMLVVVIMVSVLFSIAAPGWFGFMNRQRVSGAKTEVLQVMREAQKLAITKRGTYNVEFSAATPEIYIFAGDGTNNVTPLKTYTLGKRDGGEANVQVTTLPAGAANTLVFNFDGSIDLDDDDVDDSLDYIYKAVVSPEGEANPRRCVVIDTLLGSMSEGSGTDCDA